MRFGSLLVLALPLVVACGSDGADQSVSGVFPSSAFLGRQVRVEISGDVTEWKDGATVNFGDGVTVANVTVASPTALFADVTVAPDAAPGLRDVVVDSGGKKLTLTEAFQLESAITLKFRGSVAQGSIASFAINNHDFDTPFDDTSTGDGFFTPIEYTNITVDAASGVTFQIDSVTPFAITGIALFDLDAAPGPFTVTSGVEGDLIKSSLGQNLDVLPRTATPLTANTPVSGVVDIAMGSSLYEFTPTAAPGLVTLTATSTSSAAAPGLALLPASGRFEDLIAYSAKNNLVQMQAQKLYAIYFDNTGSSGYQFTVKANSQTMTLANEAEPNNTTATAGNATALPFLFRTATLASAADVDWIKVTVTAAEIGKKFRVTTMGNDPQTDTIVQVFRQDGTTVFGNPSSDDTYHSDLLSPAIDAAGVYMVKVTASPEFVATHNAYEATVWLE